MFYELWDLGAGKGLVRYRSETETASLVRSLVDHHGDDYAADLSLSIEDAEGNQMQSLDGEALLAWADEVLGHSLVPNGRRSRGALTQTGATERGPA